MSINLVVANTSDSCAEARSIVGWAKRKRAHPYIVAKDRWWARRESAFSHPTHFHFDAFSLREPAATSLEKLCLLLVLAMLVLVFLLAIIVVVVVIIAIVSGHRFLSRQFGRRLLAFGGFLRALLPVVFPKPGMSHPRNAAEPRAGEILSNCSRRPGLVRNCARGPGPVATGGRC
jgi:hypothetical protein